MRPRILSGPSIDALSLSDPLVNNIGKPHRLPLTIRGDCRYQFTAEFGATISGRLKMDK